MKRGPHISKYQRSHLPPLDLHSYLGVKPSIFPPFRVLHGLLSGPGTSLSLVSQLSRYVPRAHSAL